MSEVIKLIRNTDMYFQYETSSTPTTEDELQAYLKNTHAVVENLTDAYLWQPSTAYAVGTIVRTANMPAGTYAKCTSAGTSGTNEPSWNTTSATFNDGSCIWKLVTIVNSLTAVGDVTGTGDSNANGAMSISLALSNVTTAGNVGDNIDATARSFTVPYFTVDAKGRVTSYGKRTITVANATGDSMPITAGSHGAINPSAASTMPSNYVINTFNVNRSPIGSGTYSVRTMIQHLLNMAHTHSPMAIAGSNCNCNCNCDCDCDCSDDSGP